MSRTAIRPAMPADAGDVLALVRDLAIYEKQSPAIVKLTEAGILRDGFGPAPRFEMLVALLGGRIEGFALFYPNYSTWEGVAGLYVEDLFVREAARGRGLGRGLITRIAELAVERGCARVDLNVLDWNPAREFYHRIGLKHLAEWLPYRLTGADLRHLGNG